MVIKKRIEVEERPAPPPTQRDLFTRLAGWTIRATGGRWGFSWAFLTVIVWAASGPLFHYSEDWQLVINTGTTIVTFLMVFLIQNAQNRESMALHLKLNELILAVNRARNELIDIEHLTEEELNLLAERYHRVAEEHQDKLEESFALAGECRASTAAAKNGRAAAEGSAPGPPARRDRSPK